MLWKCHSGHIMEPCDKVVTVESFSSNRESLQRYSIFWIFHHFVSNDCNVTSSLSCINQNIE